jgi:hypothetical protein
MIRLLDVSDPELSSLKNKVTCELVTEFKKLIKVALSNSVMGSALSLKLVDVRLMLLTFFGVAIVLFF